ncbi:MAG: hypothetical protein ACQERJ_04800 [Bacillota bacterium]
MKKGIIMIALIICFSFSPVLEANTFGDNSLLTIPTADILEQQNLNASYQLLDERDLLVFNYGFNENVQLGTNLDWTQGLDDDVDVYPTIKVKLVAEQEDFQPAVAVGVFDRNYYITASKTTSISGIRAHAGLFNYDGGDNEGFLGVSKVLNPVTISTDNKDLKMPVTTVIAEYNEGFNLGTKLRFNQNISADLGVVDLFDDSEFTLGLNFKNKF